MIRAPRAPIVPTKSAPIAAKPSPVMPPAHATLPASAFSDAWKTKLGGGAALGMRLIGQAKVETARGEASRRAFEIHPKPEDAVARDRVYDERLMAYVAVFGTTDPNDKTRAYFTLDNVGDALTPDGVRRLYDDYEAFTIAVSPLRRPLDDDGVAALVASLPVALSTLNQAAQVRARKLLAFVASELAAAGPEDATAEEVADFAADEVVREVQLRR